VSGTGNVGGIAGGVNGSIKNCAALNPSVTATSNNAGRVAGYIYTLYTSNTFSGNKAWDEMGTGGGAAFTTNADKDGTGISTAQVQNGSGLPASLKINPWTYTIGNLPILDGLEGQDGTLPAHLATAD
jgi:hypothetical protein